MMGRQTTGREQLFYTFSMEDHVPEDHLLRGIHQFLDLTAFRQLSTSRNLRPSNTSKQRQSPFLGFVRTADDPMTRLATP